MNKTFTQIGQKFDCHAAIVVGIIDFHKKNGSCIEHETFRNDNRKKTVGNSFRHITPHLFEFV